MTVQFAHLSRHGFVPPGTGNNEIVPAPLTHGRFQTPVLHDTTRSLTSLACFAAGSTPVRRKRFATYLLANEAYAAPLQVRGYRT